MSAATRDKTIRTLYALIAAGDFRTKVQVPRQQGRARADALALARTDQARLDTEFQLSALAAVGLTGHPKAGRAYDLAHSYGHAQGRAEVLSFLEDLADLLLR